MIQRTAEAGGRQRKQLGGVAALGQEIAAVLRAPQGGVEGEVQIGQSVRMLRPLGFAVVLPTARGLLGLLCRVAGSQTFFMMIIILPSSRRRLLTGYGAFA